MSVQFPIAYCKYFLNVYVYNNYIFVCVCLDDIFIGFDRSGTTNKSEVGVILAANNLILIYENNVCFIVGALWSSL